MDVRGPLPFHAPALAAKAYGVARPAKAPATRPVTGPAAASAPAASTPALPEIAPAAARPTDRTPTGVSAAGRLVAGRVSVPADPALASQPVHTSAYAMYTRSADRVEVATAVALGRTVDRKA